MHVSERLLQYYVLLDTETRKLIQQRVMDSLGDGKSLKQSFLELTGELNHPFSTEKKTSSDFKHWLNGEVTDSSFLVYYVALLERHDFLMTASIEAEKDEFFETDVTQSDTPIPLEPVAKNESTTQAPKKRYISETPVPSRSERSKFQQQIEPARAPRKRMPGIIMGLIAIMLIVGGGYIALPYITSLFEQPKEEAASPKPVEPEPVVAAPEVNEAWISVKNASLLSTPDSDDVAYVGDIGDRYTILEEQDNYILLDLGIDEMKAWASRDNVTTEWQGVVLSDPQLLTWLQTGVDQTYIQTTVEEYLAMSEEELLEELGEPYGRDADALNDYLFYDGIFFVIQGGQVHAIDWTNTGHSKDKFLQIGTPTYETEDAVVYESESYSLRLFVGANESTRIRLTKL